MNNIEPITCISGGPFIGVQTGGKHMVRAVVGGERLDSLVAAFIKDIDLKQMALAWPSIGISRDYRKATTSQVCAALTKEGVEHVMVGPSNDTPNT
jgi:hypothetical protein